MRARSTVIGSAGLLVSAGLAEALPPVLGDGVQLQQLMLNLIMNGIEAMASATSSG